MFAEFGADEVERYGIDARIGVGQDEADDLQRVPEVVVIFLRIGIEVEPQKVDVDRQEANKKQGYQTLQIFEQEK
jgi:hypothetical protein